MTEWIDVLVFATFLAVVWFVLPTVNARFTVPVVHDRNPDWLAAHPEVAHRLNDSVWFRWLSYVLGAVSLASLVAAQLGFWPDALSAPTFEPERWMVLSDIHTASVIVWLVVFAAASAIFSRWLERNVPLAERRAATLEPRSIETFVPRWLRRAVYTAVGLHLAVWVVVGAIGVYSTTWDFWGTLLFQFVIAAIFLVIARGIAHRRPNAMDRMFGPDYRLTEVRLAFAAQLIPLLNGGARLYEELSGTAMLDIDRLSRLGIVAFMIVMCMNGLTFTGSTGPRSSRGSRPLLIID